MLKPPHNICMALLKKKCLLCNMNSKLEDIEDEEILPLYWHYRMRVDALRKIVVVQDIKRNELKTYGHVGYKTFHKFMTSFITIELVERIRFAIFVTLKSRAELYFQNQQKIKGKRRHGKKVRNDLGQEILDEGEAKAYIYRKHKQMLDEAMAFEMIYTEEISDSLSLLYRGATVTAGIMNRLHEKWKDQEIPQEFQNAIHQYLVRLKAT